ncbi:Uncharacterised protein [Bordetella pertussis]|nr:Uncharacterised protein [Bordetella pertussis]
MRRKPSHRVSVPNSSTITSTDTRAMSNSETTMAWKTSGSPRPSQRYRAAAAAVRKKASQSLFSMSGCAVRRTGQGAAARRRSLSQTGAALAAPGQFW